MRKGRIGMFGGCRLPTASRNSPECTGPPHTTVSRPLAVPSRQPCTTCLPSNHNLPDSTVLVDARYSGNCNDHSAGLRNIESRHAPPTFPGSRARSQANSVPSSSLAPALIACGSYGLADDRCRDSPRLTFRRGIGCGKAVTLRRI